MSDVKTDWNELDINLAIQTGLETLGADLVSQASLLLQRNKHDGDGILANSISFSVNGSKSNSSPDHCNLSENQFTLSYGSNTSYSAYVNYGVGIYAMGGGGRQTPWVYYHKGKKQFFKTVGFKPAPFLTPPLANTSRIMKVFSIGVDSNIQKQLGD